MEHEQNEIKEDSRIKTALENREHTHYGMYADVGTVLDDFSTRELVEYFIDDVKYGDHLLRNFLEDSIIKDEINKSVLKNDVRYKEESKENKPHVMAGRSR